MLYQMLAGNLSKPMAPGWEQDIADELLREDIRLATHGDPARRLASAAELAARLRNREARRAQEQRLRSAEAQARLAQESIARERARRPYRIALLLVLLGGLAVALGLFAETRRARDEARRELERASAVNQFLNEDLISKSNPLVLAMGKSAQLKDVLLAARDRVAGRFAGQPLAAASIHANLGALFNTVEQLPEAESEFRQALALYEQAEGPAALDSLKVRSDLARQLTRVSKFDAALEQIHQLQALIGNSSDPEKQYLLVSAWSLYHFNLSQFDKALPELQQSLRLLAQTDPDNTLMRDTLRQELIPVYRYSGHRAEAKQEAQALLQEMEARPQGNDLSIAFVKQMQAGPYIDDGEYDTAEAMLLDAQKTIVAALGPAHSRNLQLLNDLMDIAQRRKDWPQALGYAQQLHDGLVAKFGPDHIMSSVTLGNWGQMLYMSGDAGAAAVKLNQAYTKLVAITSPQGPQAQYCAFWLAAAQIELGQTDQAGALLATLKPELLEKLIANGVWQARLQGLRSLWLSRRGQRQEAAQTLQAALNGLKPEQVDFIIFDKAKQALQTPS
jgi:eukaryotic-like serine/threonine-protein kinase